MKIHPRISILFLFSIFAHTISLSQDNTTGGFCYQQEYHNHKMETDPEYRKAIIKEQAEIKAYEELHGNVAGQRGAVKIIPIVFHVVHNGGTENISDAQVEDQVRIFNKDFTASNAKLSQVPSAFSSLIGNANVEFRLATIDPNGNATNGITRHQSSAQWIDGIKALPDAVWPKNKYINIWTVGNINPGGVPGTIKGYADVDGILVRDDNVGTIGSAVNPSYGEANNGGSTPSHEIGHWFGLAHLWGNNTCDDGISDTPNQLRGNFNCPSFPKVSTCSGSNNAPNGDMFMNFMDNATCRYMFTSQQASRMNSSLNGSSSKRNLWSSVNLKATGTDGTSSPNPVTSFTANRQTICGAGSVVFTDNSTGSPTSWSWSFPGGSPSSSNAKNPTVSYSGSGDFNVTLTATNGSGSNTKTESKFISVSASGKAMPFSEGFEGSFPPSSWKVVNVDNKVTWGKRNVGKTGSGSAYMYNWNYDQGNGQVDELILPGVNLKGVSPKLTFQVAYATFTAPGQGFSDRLEVQISSNCGTSFTSIYDKRLILKSHLVVVLLLV